MSQWDALDASDKAYAIQTQRTLDAMAAYEAQLANDEMQRKSVRGR